MNYILLFIALLIIGAIWMFALAMAIFYYYSNLRKIDKNEESFGRSYFTRFILVSILVPASLTVLVILFFIFSGILYK